MLPAAAATAAATTSGATATTAAAAAAVLALFRLIDAQLTVVERGAVELGDRRSGLRIPLSNS